jgi:2-amino-4-hydroxy-6-hydroxymethyldihydropteridine diphosphokinase
MAEIGFGLGSNIGDKVAHLTDALERLFDGEQVRFAEASSIYRTEPWGHADQDWFANLCAVGISERPPREILAHCQAIERALGREPTFRWGPRVIDIDILYYDAITLDEADFTLPHREVFNRAFVLVPLAEIRPALRIAGRVVAEAAQAMAGSPLEVLGPPWRPRRRGAE